jgi:hypothetical protein
MKPEIKAACPRAIIVWTMHMALTLTLSACSPIQPPNSLVEDKKIKAMDINQKQSAAPVSTAIKPSTEPEAEKGMDRYSGFNAAYKTAKENPSDAGKNAEFLTEGIALVQASCSSYFTRLGNDGQHLGFAKKETSLAGSLAAALMGMYDASAKAISATAAGFGFATATMDNFSDTYLFSPDIRAVQDLVMSALDVQRTYGSQIVKDVRDGKSLTYTQVTQFLLEMESYCQPHGVRALVTKAVGTQKAVADTPPGSKEQLEQSIKDFKAAAEKAQEALDKAKAPQAAASNAGSAVRSQAITLQSK